jgi:hypothetical protein
VPGEDELRRQFDAAISGMELADLRRLAVDLALSGQQPFARSGPRPRLRVERRSSPALYRLRVDLDHAHPPIWRRLAVRSDVTLDVVHQVLQSSFGWTDSHLHRFALGGDPFDAHSELFLCPYDVDEGEDEGTPVSDVRLDETLREPGDTLHYVYDYGDSWDLVIRLEAVRDLPDGAPVAACLDGARAAPPEDCGGLRVAEDLAEVLDDPAHFDVAEINQALQDPFVALRELGLRPDLVVLLTRLRGTATGDALALHALRVIDSPRPSEDELTANLRAHLWFLDRASGAGIELTSAGYLKPADVELASEIVPTMGDWIGKNNREYHCIPLLEFRQSLQRMGLLRKYKGKLLLTRAGRVCRGNPTALWQHLSACLLAERDGEYAEQARLLALLHMASEPEGEHSRRLADALTQLGWRRRERQPLGREDVRWVELDVQGMLANVSDHPRRFTDRRALSPAAIALARTALSPGH